MRHGRTSKGTGIACAFAGSTQNSVQRVEWAWAGLGGVCAGLRDHPMQTQKSRHRVKRCRLVPAVSSTPSKIRPT
jgi:hypothetical protein